MVKIPFAITGTLHNPQVGLEWDGMRDLTEDAARSWAEQALEDVKRKASEWLREQAEKRDDG